MWELGLGDIVNSIGIEKLTTNDSPFKDVSVELNEGKQKHVKDHPTFKSLFVAEVQGIVDVFKQDFSAIMQYVYERDTGHQLSAADRKADDSGRCIANLIFHAFRLGRVTHQFPTIRIEAGLHAAVRWDKKRKYKANDTFDFKHASAALPYCDLFLTERSLCQLLSDGNLRFAKHFPCRVISAPNDALQAVKEIGAL